MHTLIYAYDMIENLVVRFLAGPARMRTKTGSLETTLNSVAARFPKDRGRVLSEEEGIEHRRFFFVRYWKI